MELRSAISYALECIGKGSLELKREQLEAVQSIYKGQDAFIFLPTGFGKSICYECLPFLYDFKFNRMNIQDRSTVLVVSPLISLMTNQVSSLKKRGVSAAILRSSRGDEINPSLVATHRNLKIPGMYSILFSSPEAVIGIPEWRCAVISSSVQQSCSSSC